jgi:hypothetical protein
LGATSGLATFFGLALLAGFVFFDEGLCGALGFAAADRLAAALGAFLANFFLLAVVFFLLAAFFAGMALASKTLRKEAAIIQRSCSSGRVFGSTDRRWEFDR